VAKTEICKTCKYMEPHPDLPEGSGYLCHRYPPVMQGSSRQWPYVLPTDWCGEYKHDGILREFFDDKGW
jgi:hypothetical protein